MTQTDRESAENDLPPRLPESIAELDRVQGVLGAIVRGDQLGVDAQARLYASLGGVPAKKLAARWRRSLRMYREELLHELGDAHAAGSKTPPALLDGKRDAE